MYQALFQVLGIKWRAKAPKPYEIGRHQNSSCLEECCSPFYRWKSPEPKLLSSSSELPSPAILRYSKWKCHWGPVARSHQLLGWAECRAWTTKRRLTDRAHLLLWLGPMNSRSQGTLLPHLTASQQLTNFALVLTNECCCTDFTDEKIEAQGNPAKNLLTVGVSCCLPLFFSSVK